MRKLALLLALLVPVVAVAQPKSPPTRPGGTNGQIQFNLNGQFGGIATTGTGSVVLGTAPTISNPTITGGSFSGAAVAATSVVSGSPTGGNLGAGTVNATGVFVNGVAVGGGLSVPSAPLLSGNGSTLGSVTAINSIPIGGATPAAGAFTTLNVTGAAGVQQFGSTVLNVGPLSNPAGTGAYSAAIFVGPYAGAAFPIGTADIYGTIGVGAGSLQSLSVNGTENTCGGTWSCQYVTTGGLDAAWGMHALGFDTTSAGNSAFGVDCMRDSISGGYVTCLGESALAHGNPGTGTVAVGALTIRGNSGGVIIGGSNTTGDVITVTLTASSSSIVVTPSSYSEHYTVQSGDTIASIATNIAAAMNGRMTSPSMVLAVAANALPGGSYVVDFFFPGTASTGWDAAVTSSCSGTCTETLTNISGAAVTNATAVGSGAMEGFALQSAAGDSAFGSNALTAVQTASFSSAFGYNSLANLTTASGQGADSAFGAYTAQALTTGYEVSCFGFESCNVATTSINLTAVGAKAAYSFTTGNNLLALGGQTGNTCQTGTNIILIGSLGSGNGGGSADCPAASTSNYINVGSVWTVTGLNTPSTSLTTLAGELVSGGGTVQATATTTGFFHLPFVAAAPTGTPAVIDGNACIINTASESLNCYIGSSWYHLAMTSGAN